MTLREPQPTNERFAQPYFVVESARYNYNRYVHRVRKQIVIEEIQRALQTPKRTVATLGTLTTYELDGEHGPFYALVSRAPGLWPAVVAIWRE